VARLTEFFPAFPIHPIVGDFTRPVTLPSLLGDTPRLGVFLGSTLGNMAVPIAVDFLRTIGNILGKDSMLLIGIDRIKDPRTLLAAYDDAQGVTAEFNLNLLHRMNRELSGTIPVEAFRHLARWNDLQSRIEMHLEAARTVHFTIADRSFAIAAGETIHTESSHKYGPRGAQVLLRAGGWDPVMEWTDSHAQFALILAESISTPRIA
jgi:L-histidine Nalpha-methyltransferase